MSSIMATLAENYKLGILGISAVLIGVYVFISVLTILRIFKNKGYVSLAGVVPIVNLILYIREKGISKKNNTMGDGNSTLDDDYIIEDMF